MKYLIIALTLLSTVNANALTFNNYLKKPKLVIVLVIDQFRADFLTRFQKTFMDEKVKSEVGGFNFLMKNGAYFPNAEYNVLQSMTCPGHAMIMSGALPHENGIVLNEWFEKKTNKKIYCVSDDEYKLSPRRLKGTTLGDELKNVYKSSKVYSIALKDRSSIMLGGYRADLALWIDNDEMKWTTSSFYRNDIPDWVKAENEKLVKNYKLSKENIKEAKKDLATYLGVKITVDMAIKAIQEEKLGKNVSPDILAISFSTHDMSGHTNGPDSLEIRGISHVEDREISRLLNVVKKSLGSLDDVTVVLTADHGIAPNVETSQANKIDSGKIDYDEVYKKVNERLTKKFGKPSKDWIQGHRSFHFYLNEENFTDKPELKALVQAEMKTVVKTIHGVRDVATSNEIDNGKFPIGEIGEQLKRQYLAGISGDVILIPEPFYMEKDDNCTTHITGYSYDRSVPLILMGKNFKAGVYSGANVIDMAPTLSFILGILPGSNSTGKVLSQTLGL